MTYSGVLMLVTCAAAARLILQPKEWIWPAIAVPALLVALVATQARNAWIGTFFAVCALLAVRNWKLIIAAPILAALVLAVAPPQYRARAYSIVDPNDPTNRDRVAMLHMGAAMVKDHPLFGVGPEMVQRVYPKYRPSYAVNPTNPHLHNVPVQIAAERGLPALAAWLTFVVVAAGGLFRQLRRGPAQAIAGAGLAALIAMIFAGLFEYNFGDSEFLILFLGLITLPFASAHPRELV
jgi:O-antigen ligase